MSALGWSLVADLGGTSARFALAPRDSMEPALRWETRVAEHPDFAEALACWLGVVAEAGAWSELPDAACFAIASPQPEEPRVRMLNAPWVLDRATCAETLGLDAVSVLNDFEALGYAIADVPNGVCTALVEGSGRPDAPRLVLGPGTGLGSCCVLMEGERPRVIPAEGGHVDLPVTDETEWAIYQALREAHGHVSAERVLSGSGLLFLYRFFCKRAGTPEAASATPESVAQAARGGQDPAAREAVMQFLGFLGAVAGNAVLSVGARGGVYLVGNILADLAEFMPQSPFLQRLQGKGRYRDYLAAVPVRLVISEGLALIGALRYLRESRQLRESGQRRD